MTVYTLISYKESYYSDRYNEHFNSAWDINVFENKEDIVNDIFSLKVKVREAIGLGGNDDEWEYVVLIDGRRTDDWTDEQNEEDPRFWDIEKEARALFDEWLEKEEDRKRAKLLEEETKKKRAAEASAAAVVKREKELLKKLQEKYPNG